MINPSIKYPDSLLKFLRNEELEIISKLFNVKDLSIIDIERELTKSLLSFNGFFRNKLTYNEILDTIIKKKNLVINTGDSVQHKEEKILLYRFKKFVDSLNKEEKEKFEAEIQQYVSENEINKDQVLSAGAISTLAIANLSGFGLYIMASTIVGGLTSILGITLPFVFYTSMSSVLSVIIGPIGWTLGLGYIAYSFRNDNFETASNKIIRFNSSVKNSVFGNVDHTILCVSFIASCRIILKEENIKRRQSFERSRKNFIIEINQLKQNNIKLIKDLELLNKTLNKNYIDIENLEEETFKIEVEIRKIDNFINQTFKLN